MKTRPAIFAISAALTALWSAGGLAAEEFTKGPGALQVFDLEGLAATPLWIKLWLAVLVSTFLVGLFVFAWRRPIARGAAGGFLVSLATGHLVFGALDLPMLGGAIGLWHVVCWTPALVLLLWKRPFFDPAEGRWFRIWSGVMTAVIVISFVFDIRDAAIYIGHFSRQGA